MTTETKTLVGIIQPDGVTVKEKNTMRMFEIYGVGHHSKDYSDHIHILMNNNAPLDFEIIELYEQPINGIAGKVRIV